MLRSILSILSFTFFFGATGLAEEALLLEDFQSYLLHSTPKEGWKSRGGEASVVYKIDADGQSNKFLHAKDTGQSIQFFKDSPWSIKEYPILSWRWKVMKFPEGADEREGGKNDSAAGLYVVFPRKFFVPEVIKYVWSTKAPKDLIIARKDRFPIFVVRSSSTPNEWVTETRNVSEDYERHFKEKAPNPVAIGFLSDANDTKSIAEAGYDDIQILKAITGPKTQK